MWERERERESAGDGSRMKQISQADPTSIGISNEMTAQRMQADGTEVCAARAARQCVSGRG